MSFREDQWRIRKNNVPQALAIIRYMALNLIQRTKAQMKRQFVKRLKKMGFSLLYFLKIFHELELGKLFPKVL